MNFSHLKESMKRWNLSKAACALNVVTFPVAVFVVVADLWKTSTFIDPVVASVVAYSWGYSWLVAAVAVLGEAVRNFFFRKKEERDWTQFWWHAGYAAVYAAFVAYVIFGILSSAPADMVP